MNSLTKCSLRNGQFSHLWCNFSNDTEISRSQVMHMCVSKLQNVRLCSGIPTTTTRLSETASNNHRTSHVWWLPTGFHCESYH